MAEYICDMIDKYDAYLEAVKKQEEENERIRQKIEMMRGLSRNILTQKYIRGRNLTEIASEIGYEYKYACTFHGNALREYANSNNNA
jgi:DNA-directed RNA polymerase specialized sigma subunit